MLKRLAFVTAVLLTLAVRTTTVQRVPHIVFMIGEDEYHTWDTLPDFAKRELEPRGYRITTIQQDPADKNNYPGLVEALRSADLLFVSVAPPHSACRTVRSGPRAPDGGQAAGGNSNSLPRLRPSARRPPGSAEPWRVASIRSASARRPLHQSLPGRSAHHRDGRPRCWRS